MFTPIPDRMPAVLRPEDYIRWLGPEILRVVARGRKVDGAAPELVSDASRLL